MIPQNPNDKTQNGNGKPHNGNGKKKFLFVSMESNISGICHEAVKEGHEVKMFIEDNGSREVADGFVPKTDDWKKEVDWADVIVFDDTLGFGAKAKRLRDEGKMVVGGTPYTDRLEDDRGFGQQELKNVGIPIIPQADFSSFDDAIAYVQQNPGQYVIKPNGEAANYKQLLYVGEEDDGKDVINILLAYKKIHAKLIKSFQLQKRIRGVEVAVGAFFNGKEFVYPINVNFEHKKLFPGDIGVNTGEMGCYDDQTEVLTSSGWKLFKDIAQDDRMCTLNPASHEIEYQTPLLTVSFSHHAELVSIQNQTLDLRVTLDHNMYVSSQQSARKGGKEFGFVKAKDLQYQSLIKRTGVWTGAAQAYFELPSVPIGHYEGRQVVFHQTPSIQIPMEDWLGFIGIWIAD
ncbi:MAG: hypothetical protein Q7R47_03785 [Candidatus Diapherotrites archaeon]|nr:hypothetical protein [Candidatus Diapherotrites archaeon]